LSIGFVSTVIPEVLVASFKNMNVLKNLVLPSVFAVVGVLSACGKPEIRSKTMDAPSPTAPSTASNPKVAEAENKAGDAAAKLAAKNDPAAAAAVDAAATRKQAALDELAELLKREGVDAQKIADAKAKVVEAGGTVPADAAALPPAKAAGSPGEGETAKAELLQQAAHRAFVIAMIEPVMRANFQVFLARNEVLRLKSIAEVEKKELSAEQKTWLQSIRRDYGVSQDIQGAKQGDKQVFDDLLERVDGVNLTFLAAPLALRSNWAIDSEVQSEKIIKRVQEMNVSTAVDKVAFRSARVSVKATRQEESLSLMKAFFGYSDQSKTAMMDKVLATVTEILKFTSEPAYDAEIERVRTVLLDEYKKNDAAKSISVEPVRK
jgi:hypothetical protein